MSLEKSKNPRDVIVAPVVSEKSYACMDRGQYTFIVAPGSQQDRDQAGRRGYLRRQGRLGEHHQPPGQGATAPGPASVSRKDTKRAIVTLREGTIDIFGDVTE